MATAPETVPTPELPAPSVKMGFWEFLDRRSERKARFGPLLRFDTQTLIGFGFLAGYYFLVWSFTRGDVPAVNKDLVRDAMLTLGPPVGLIVGAIFRESQRDRQSTGNVGQALRTIEAVAAGVPASAPAQGIKAAAAGGAARAADAATDKADELADEARPPGDQP